MKKFKFLSGEDTSFEDMMTALHEIDEMIVRTTGIDEIVGQPTVTPRFWKTGDGTDILITELSNVHIDNILNCLRDRGNMRIPDIYEGFTKQRWIEIMMEELNRRNNEGL